MNSCNFIGRLTRDPEVRYTQGENSFAVARFTLAVDKRGKDAGADFLSMKALGKNGEFAEKYLKKGMKIGVQSRAEAGSYEKNGQKIFYTEFVISEYTFCESKGQQDGPQESSGDGFMNIPEGYEEELPFN